MKNKALFLKYFFLLLLCGNARKAFSEVNNAIVPQNGNYSFSYNQVPEPLVSLGSTPSGYTFQWESSIQPTMGFTPISGATSATLSFGAVLPQTTFYRRKATQGGTVLYSNLIKLQLVSATWENYNYTREHTILIPGQTDWKTIDALPIGSKLESTTYLDGIGRVTQKITRESATSNDPDNPSVLWGDIVSFNEYDVLGREQKNYLPYSTTSQSGKFKPTTQTAQASYYSTNFGESSPFNNISFDNSPVNRVINVKGSGTSWAAGAGSNTSYELNDGTDDVKIFTISTLGGDIPVVTGVHPINSLYKIKSTDEYGKQVIEYSNSQGQLLLKKVQLNNLISDPYNGWMCTYNVYDDFDRLRYTIEPEAVNFLRSNGWSFAVTNGTQVINELCFRYEYDEKGRNTLKKTPGALASTMVYDERDRVVFFQDGNQSTKSPPEWTATIYDELDRPIFSTLYRTSKSISALKTDIAASPELSAVNITAQAITLTTHRNPISNSDLNNSSVTTILKYTFYDNYGYTGVKSFSTSFDNATAYSVAEPIVQSLRTTGMTTGTKIRILGTSTFLSASVYYDDNGRPIQSLEDNVKTGTDITTMQYQWDGRTLSINTKHSSTGTGYTDYSIVTKNLFDKLGRINGIEKKYGNNGFKKIATYAFDDMGRIKSKRLAPGYAGTGKTEIETLNYSYNLQGLTTGINKDYALKTGSYSKTDNFFGMYLGYDNKDGLFTNSKLDGRVTGVLWNTRGDDAQRKYDFMYDNAGRLIGANFTEREKTTDSWNVLKMNLAASNITYDLNGNLLSMLHKTVLPGNSAAQDLDNLSYTYTQLSNKLIRVIDAGTLGINNGKLGDFSDGGNGSNNDYVYDDNGNLIIDLNKDVKNVSGGVSTTLGTSGIKYNFLDKPEEIRIVGKGIIKIVYDADGNKLQRSYTPDGGSTRTISYINEYVFEDNALQYINFEEGRLRIMQPVSQSNVYDMLAIDGNIDMPNSKRGSFDYFISDHQSNVRMILTEETHMGRNTCSMESPSRVANEEPVFGQAGPGNEVSATRTATPPGWASNGSSYTSKLSSTGYKVGPNVLLKVMAADIVSAQAGYYYQNIVTNTSGPNNLLGNVLTALSGAINGSSATGSIVKGQSGSINTTLNGNVPFGTATAPDANNSNGDNPKAYLTVLFFDERFNFIEEGSSYDRVDTKGDGATPLSLPNIKAPKNGYAYIFISNESAEPVYFDNIQVTHERKQIIEENHYYAYGLKATAISSRKLGDINEGELKNNYLYQGNFNEYDEDIAWNDFDLRSYDPQIGRWLQMDPYDQFESPFIGMGADPINNIDEDGGWSAGLSGAVIGAAVGFAAPYLVEAITGKHIDKKGLWGIGGAVVGAGIGYGAASSLAGGGTFFQEVAAFYTGLVSPNKAGSFIGEGRGKFSCGMYNPKAEIPDLWSWMGNINLPSFGWIDDVVDDWVPFKTIIAATSLIAQANDVILQERTTGRQPVPTGGFGTTGMNSQGGEIYSIQDEGSVDPVGPGERAYEKEIGSTWGKVPGNTVLNPEGTKNISFNRKTGRIAVSQAKGSYRLGNNQTGNSGTVTVPKAETRIRVTYKRKEPVNVRKFKLFGITLFTKKIK